MYEDLRKHTDEEQQDLESKHSKLEEKYSLYELKMEEDSIKGKKDLEQLRESYNNMQSKLSQYIKQVKERDDEIDLLRRQKVDVIFENEKLKKQYSTSYDKNLTHTNRINMLCEDNKSFREILEQKKSLLSRCISESKNYSSENKRLIDERDIYIGKYDAMSKQYEFQLITFTECKAALERANIEMRILQQKLNESSYKDVNKENEISMLNSQMIDLKNELMSARANTEMLQKSETDNASKIKSMQTLLKEKEILLNETQEELKKQLLQIEKLTNSQINSENEESSQLQELKKQLDSATLQISQTGIQLKEANSTIKETSAQLTESNNKIIELNTQIENSKKAYETLNGKCQDLQKNGISDKEISERLRIADAKEGKLKAFVSKIKQINDSFESNLCCFVCMNVVKKAIMVFPCGHIFCESCISLSAKQCSQCKKGIQNISKVAIIDEISGKFHLSQQAIQVLQEDKGW